MEEALQSHLTMQLLPQPQSTQNFFKLCFRELVPQPSQCCTTLTTRNCFLPHNQIQISYQPTLCFHVQQNIVRQQPQFANF